MIWGFLILAVWVALGALTIHVLLPWYEAKSGIIQTDWPPLVIALAIPYAFFSFALLVTGLFPCGVGLFSFEFCPGCELCHENYWDRDKRKRRVHPLPVFFDLSGS